jgi:predicted enzyme related to lactoylglutathione lyase
VLAAAIVSMRQRRKAVAGLPHSTQAKRITQRSARVPVCPLDRMAAIGNYREPAETYAIAADARGAAMISNSSVPTNTMLSHVVYPDVVEAVAWLTKAFGFVEHYHYGAPSGAQMHLGSAVIMVKQAEEGWKSPKELGGGTQSLTIFVEDVEGLYRRAKAAGAKILEEPHETEYGEFQCAALDFAGHHWLFSRHAKDSSPDAWGATVVNATSRMKLLARPRLCYLEIPAVDAHASAAFYEKAFGWNIRHRESERPSFDDATGDISGAFVAGRKASREPGLLPYIWVDDIKAVFAKCVANGAEEMMAPRQESPGAPFWIATLRDPAGNAIGLYEETA